MILCVLLCYRGVLLPTGVLCPPAPVRVLHPADVHPLGPYRRPLLGVVLD